MLRSQSIALSLTLLCFLSSSFALAVAADDEALGSSSSASRGGSDSHITDFAALYLAPGFLSKATTLTVPSVLEVLRAYVHPGTSEAIDVAPQCIASHSPIPVANVNFTSFHVRAIDPKTFTVTFVDLTPMQLSIVDFAVECDYSNGAFKSVLNLPQKGSLTYVVNFPSPLVFNVTLNVNKTSGAVYLSPPVLLGQVSATPTYAYQGSTRGFAADLFVDSFFAKTVASRIVTEVTTLISFPQNLAKLWLDEANDALSVVEFACGDTDWVQDSGSMAIWMQPVCGPSSTATPTLSLLVDGVRDFLFISPSSDIRNSKYAFVKEHAKKNHEADVPALLDDKKLSGSLPSGCSVVTGCALHVQEQAMLQLNMSNCAVCYPNNGEFTELSATATFSIM